MPSVILVFSTICLLHLVYDMIIIFRESMVAVGDRVLAINESTLDNIKSAQVNHFIGAELLYDSPLVSVRVKE